MADVRSRRNFTRAEVTELLDYDPETGNLIWRIKRNSYGGKCRPGAIAGAQNQGYVQVKLFGLYYRAHHIAWLIMTGDWPPINRDTDHINRDRSDNRWSNLRLASRSQNNVNREKHTNSAYAGVTFRHDTGKWRARISRDGKTILLGEAFETQELAIEARKKAEQSMYGEYIAA